MKTTDHSRRRATLLARAAAPAIALALFAAGGVQAQEAARTFQIPAQPLSEALLQFSKQADVDVIAPGGLTQGKTARPVSGAMTPTEALDRMLEGAGLKAVRSPSGGLMLVEAAGPQSASADPGATPTAVVEELIVTAQKKEESIQDVPIAVSAFSGESLDERKIEGGSELLRAVPNVTFSKANFSMYNFSIRGIGTKAISASTDPAVAVSFNNTPLIRNRLFESEFFDVQRVEVLRGPQGTLYGRNATGGVVNMLPTMPTSVFEGEFRGEIGNFDTRRMGGFVNVPVGDTLAVRVAGAMTQRDGFDYNTVTQKNVNGRDLWSVRAIAEWEPTDSFKANFIWQHFEEDDDRSRTGKQLCTRDPSRETYNGVALPTLLQGRFSQGCKPGSLYSDDAYGAPNASGLSYIIAGGMAVTMGVRPGTFEQQYGFKLGDPFANVRQSRNLREIATNYDPVFRAKNDLYQLNLEWEITDGLTLISQTAYAKDDYYSSQDFFRFVSAPIFNDSNGLVSAFTGQPMGQQHGSPGGVFVDPQLGASRGLLSADLNRSRNEQWSQEFRLQSSFDGPFNFSVGANYLHFESQDDYFVFNNAFSFIAYNLYNRPETDHQPCPPGTTSRDCVYVDPNPIGSLDELGHNYFLSRNIVETKSWALFGEAYWNVSDTVKITAGLRFTRDVKTATPIPSQLLLGGAPDIGTSGGFVNAGYPADPPIKQRWSEPTGRLVVDWKPDLSFTDDTLVYASLSRGYKGGGSNPPRPGLNPRVVQFQPLPATFDPEYVNAIEIGTKNILDGGKLTLNATAFYYDYKDYQVSQIVDRISLNENFDARTWGLEFEAAWRPTPALRIDGSLGYLNTRIGKGAKSIDVMNRTQGNPDWVLLRPWIQVPSNCIAPKKHVDAIMSSPFLDGLGINALAALCGGSKDTGTFNPSVDGFPMNLFFGFTYDPLTEAPNGGRGFAQDLEGNELPNAPELTFNLGAQYTFFLDDWNLTLRGDYYRQSESFARVYNTEYDRLKAWDNVNLALTLRKPDADLMFQVYVKNAFDKTPITDAFTNSDDAGLTTNVFTLDPRIIGVNVTKGF
ncbi:TonB-dependent receptor domain-containing protein [Caulobacter mirabilis]|uniref:TonB-denpendent receptor n=1 Tax=Caulobacter mirabilis TaxID=69666 RepID=A0A2D2B042_9CAUL|nr:TonB-dependent receptor [Caulobacter mirabilis]ATQ43614.1 TonB-denpendent receptor [Caulobacter mirabilis]